MPARALEFYSGIGGLHLALERSKIAGQVACAFDWDQAAEQVYKHNFPATPVKRVRDMIPHAHRYTDLSTQVDISTLTASSLRDLFPDIDIWLLSPACQPYTVLNPNGKGAQDPRAQSFLHLVQVVLPDLAREGAAPRYLLVENVAGFEQSTTRQLTLSILQSMGYHCAEFLLTPLQFGIPNSRLRYYLLARRDPFPSISSKSAASVLRYIPGHGSGPWIDPRTEGPASSTVSFKTRCLQEFLDQNMAESIAAKYTIPDKVLVKWGWLFDIVYPSDRRTCCFTRGYTKLVERAGSILQMNEDMDTTQTFEEYQEACQETNPTQALQILRPLRLRYFTPQELLCLFGFNDPGLQVAYKWPYNISEKTKYRLIGNSVNIHVVTNLVNYLVS
ncbi:S-adenosyl-L-methionine-dependent methyltransferase [Schizophyllum commune H4-8]|uniref:S-adenosyl-L-methionine-dependent methyltransferase n=1 Tax=Schizophyllum commune (strain H4-8 / FGSC 9210) TaxID=578458 RepID=UPI00215F5D99|nr:S-adenosyl-L-methionine-dependent methyltransferase [Schizophyllum commune H4-8]KAI5885227.1 S-adenosyl-L-methionine-dependent methyltransferase [Schizophyllum commune H4-8]